MGVLSGVRQCVLGRQFVAWRLNEQIPHRRNSFQVPTALVVPHQGLRSSPLIACISREVKFLCSLTAMENTSFPHSQLLFTDALVCPHISLWVVMIILFKGNTGVKEPQELHPLNEFSVFIPNIKIVICSHGWWINELLFTWKMFHVRFLFVCITVRGFSLSLFTTGWVDSYVWTQNSFHMTFRWYLYLTILSFNAWHTYDGYRVTCKCRLTGV